MKDYPILNEIDIADSENCGENSKVVNTYSIRGNRYVKVKEIDKVYTPGNYLVGMDIDCGEYYFWGDCIYAEIKGKKAHYITGAFGTCFDAYS